MNHKIGNYYEASCGSFATYIIRLDDQDERYYYSCYWVVKGSIQVQTGLGSFSQLIRELSNEEVKHFLSQTKKSEHGKHNRTEGSVCQSASSEREREGCGTDSIQSRRSKFRLASIPFTDTQRAVKGKSKIGRVKINLSS